MSKGSDRHSSRPTGGATAGSRFLERGAVLGYRSGAWLIGHLPETFARGLLRWGLRATYSLWPSKRRNMNANFARVLGLEPDGPEVRRAAMAAYGTYARYLVELMRLPGLDDVAAYDLVDTANLLPLEEYWRETRRGLILTTAHMGNLEGVARGVARHGWPIAGLADDTAFPELFDHLRRQRESWGVNDHPLAQPARDVRRAPPARRCLPSSWTGATGRTESRSGCSTPGRRSRPGQPSWRPRPARAIVHIAIRRAPDGRRFLVTHGDPIDVSVRRPRRSRAGDTGRRRRARGGDRRGARPVVQLQAPLAVDAPRRRRRSPSARLRC